MAAPAVLRPGPTTSARYRPHADEGEPFGHEPYLNVVVLSPVREVTHSSVFTTLTLCQTVDQSQSRRGSGAPRPTRYTRSARPAPEPPQFDMVLRGYDRIEVDEYIAALLEENGALRRELEARASPVRRRDRSRPRSPRRSSTTSTPRPKTASVSAPRSSCGWPSASPPRCAPARRARPRGWRPRPAAGPRSSCARPRRKPTRSARRPRRRRTPSRSRPRRRCPGSAPCTAPRRARSGAWRTC